MKARSDELLEKLSQLPSRKLAAALVELRYSADCIEPAIERLLVGSEERVERFRSGLKKALAGGSQVNRIESLLLELNDPGIDPASGFSALIELFENDETLILQYDYDYGSVGFLLEGSAAELLAGFASRMDEEAVVSALEDLLLKDDYGVRAHVWHRVSRDLSPASLRSLEAALKGPQYRSESPKRVAQLLESLATHLGDVTMLEAALTTDKPALEPVDYLKLAQMHLSQGEFQSTLERLEADPARKASDRSEGRDIRIRCLKELGRSAEHFLASWERFAAYPTLDSFEKLVQELGEEHRDKLSTKVAEHLPHTEFQARNAVLLLHLGYAEEAERYVLGNRRSLERAFYGDLADLADLLKSRGKNQAAVLCYRQLLEDILARGKSKAYHYAVDYYRELGEIDPEYNNYTLALRTRHSRKYSFWALMEKR